MKNLYDLTKDEPANKQGKVQMYAPPSSKDESPLTRFIREYTGRGKVADTPLACLLDAYGKDRKDAPQAQKVLQATLANAAQESSGLEAQLKEAQREFFHASDLQGTARAPVPSTVLDRMPMLDLALSLTQHCDQETYERLTGRPSVGYEGTRQVAESMFKRFSAQKYGLFDGHPLETILTLKGGANYDDLQQCARIIEFAVKLISDGGKPVEKQKRKVLVENRVVLFYEVGKKGVQVGIANDDPRRIII